MKILLIGYGNPGRLDDGLGPALAERFQQAEPAPEKFPFAGASAVAKAMADRRTTGRKLATLRSVPPALTIETNYQLNVEDAAQIAEVDVVIFADASTDAEPPFTFSPVIAEEGGLSFSSHSVSAPQLMGMVRDLFHAEPKAYMLAIRGYEFNEFGEMLSEKAKENLDRAVDFLKTQLLVMAGEK